MEDAVEGVDPRSVLKKLTLISLSVVALCGASVSSATAAPASTDPFLATGPLRSPLPSDAPLDPNSSAVVADLNSQVASWGEASLNTSRYSAPIYTVPANEPTQNVRWNNCLNQAATTQAFVAATTNVPIPANAVPSIGTDGQMVIYQPSTDTDWEFWRAADTDGHWSACGGGHITNVSRSGGAFATGGVSGSGLAMLGYLIRVSDLQSGSINHAIDIQVPCIRKSAFSYPATRTDGSCSDPNAPAEGERFRLPASLNLSTLNLSRGELMIARAMQQYGAIITDYAGRPSIQAEDPRPYETNGAPDPYASFFPGQQNDWLKGLPLQDLQAVAWNYGEPSPHATFTYPASGQTGVNPSTTFTWGKIAAAEGYQLWVGTTPGGDDLLKSGVLSADTSSLEVPMLPTGQPVYACLYTEVAGDWHNWQNITFSAAPNPVSFTYPTAGETDVSSAQPFTWSTVADAQAYQMTVGTTLGGSDVANSGILPASASSYRVGALPTGETLYARIKTEIDGNWTNLDISFTVPTQVGPVHFSYPSPGQSAVKTFTPFSWSPATDATAYKVTIGDEPGVGDLANSGVLPAGTTSFQEPALPTGKTLYARIATETGGVWSDYQDITFRAAANPVLLTNLVQGQTQGSSGQLTWSTSPAAVGYQLTIGTSLGARNLFYSGFLKPGTSSVQLPALPTGETLYARIYTGLASGWGNYEDVLFTVGSGTSAGFVTAIDRLHKERVTEGQLASVKSKRGSAVHDRNA